MPTASTNSDAAIQQAARHLAEGRADAAIPLLESLAEAFPAYVTAHVLLARAYESAGRPADALEAWHNAYFLMPTSPLVRRQRSRMIRQRAANLPDVAADPAQQAYPTAHRDEADSAQATVDTADLHVESLGVEWTWEEEEVFQEDAPSESLTDDAGVEFDDIDWSEARPDESYPALDEVTPKDEKPEEPEFSEEDHALGYEREEASVGQAWDDFVPTVHFQDVEDDAFDDVELEIDSSADLELDDQWVPLDFEDEEDDDVVETEVIPPFSKPREDAPPSEPTGDGWRIVGEADSLQDPPRPPLSPTEGPQDSGIAWTDKEKPDDQREPDPLDEVEDLDALIEQLERAPRIRPEQERRTNSGEHDDLDEEVVTETLARIYEAQGQLEAAAAAYTRLATQHPERADEFSRRAAEVRRRSGS